VYVWRSASLLDAPTAEDTWRRFTDHGIRRLLVSLDRSQIDSTRTPGGRARLLELLAEAKARGITVDLLLGEPTWILPRHRGDLLAVVRRLAFAPFAALHLDLEPSQLDEATLGTERLLRDLLDTLAAAHRESPWPLALSLHPRYLTPPLSIAKLADRLAAAGVREVALMTYVTRMERVLEIVRPIVERHPRLAFAVAQSVESTLPPENSHATAGHAELERRLDRLERGLPAPNFVGVILQAWEDYERLPP